MLTPMSRVRSATFGPMDFWAEMNSLQKLARADGRTYPTYTKVHGRRLPEDAVWLTYEEWDYLFERAVEAGVMAVHDDGKGNPSARFANPFAMGLLRLWRAMGAARAEGRGPLEFARAYASLIESDVERGYQESEDADRAQARRREDAADDLRTRKREKTKLREATQDAAGGW